MTTTTLPPIVESVSTSADGFGRWSATALFTHTLSETDTRPQFNLGTRIPVIRRAARDAIVRELMLREQKVGESPDAVEQRVRKSLRLEISGQIVDSLNRWRGITYREKE